MRNRLFLSLSIWGLLFGLMTPISASAIDVYGSIRGVVTDPSGAVIAGATVTATNEGTGISVSATSAADGSYQFLQLPAPSTYTVKCEKSGFKSYVAEKVRLIVGQVYVQAIEMQLGQVTQQVTVEAAPTQVEKTSIQLSATLGASTIVDMPLSTRNWVQLQQTLPGVVAAADGRGNYATNGSQPDQNSYLINGIDSNDLPLNTPLVIPSPDAIAEVSMVTNTINPEYGRNSGGIMNAVTKSGGNAFHGSGFEFFRDTGMNARNFFSPSSIVYHQHEFGGTVGGPIKKDKAFFFFSYQGYRNRIPQNGGAVTVFSPDQRNGNWGAGHFDCTINTTKGQTPADCPSSPTAMFGDASSTCPTSGAACPAGTPYGNVYDQNNALVQQGLWATGSIPTADMNTLALNMMKQFVPLPNSGNEFDFNPVTTGVDDQYLTRIDYNFSEKDALWGSWMWEKHPTTDTLPFTGATVPGFPDQNQRHIQTYSLTWNHTLSATTLNEFRLGYTRFNYGAALPVNVLDPASVGFTGITPQDKTMSSWPVVALTGYFTLGFSTNGPQPRIDQTYQLDDNFSYIRGKHTFKVGFDARKFYVYNPFAASLSGNYGYGGSGAYSTGDAGPDFMLGIPDTYTQGGFDIIDARGTEYYSYFQDQYRMRKNLTITYGTGWQVDLPTEDTYHSNHAMTAWRPGVQSTLFPNSPVGYVFQGDPGVNAAGVTKYGHFGPRFGFAWDPTGSGKWSIRGGYGIYFNRELEEQSLQFLNSPPFSVSSTGAAACNGQPGFVNPFQDIVSGKLCANPFPLPGNPASNVDFSPYEPIFPYVIDPNSSVPYSQNFNLNVQYQLTHSTLVTASYVGALGRKEVILTDLNPPRNPAACAADPSCVANRVYQGFYFPQYFSYNPNVVAGIGQNQTTGNSNYNALQVTVNKHMSHGLQFDATYTWSHAMDNGSGFENSGFGGGGFGGYGSVRATSPYNQALYDYGPSEYDATHRFVITYTYQIPSIRNFNNWALKRMFGGWEMAGITTLQSGFPLDVIDSGFRSLTYWAGDWTSYWDVPNVVSAPKYQTVQTSSIVNCVKGCTATTAAKNHYIFDPNTFARAPIGVQGNAGRNPLRGPGIANFDWGFYKDTNITEKTRVELRFEFYNLWNHTQFSNNSITTNINSANFGRDLSARDPRIVQLAAKFYF